MYFAASVALENIFCAVVAVLVISAVIFVHELGHFLAARMAGVMVERFSIGMGPVLWSFKLGETQYALSAVPIGGYVMMRGQTDTPDVEEVDDHPRSYQSKPVLWRMFIISAGVAMNLVFGFLLFALAYRSGVPYNPAVIGAAYPGKPAWGAGIREGDRLLAINGARKNDFNDIRRTVMLTDPRSESVEFEMSREVGGQEKNVAFDVRPLKSSNGLHPQVGVIPSPGLTFVRWESDPGPADSPAAKAAAPGFRGGDRIVAVDDVPVANFHQLNSKLYEKRASAIVVTVRRDADQREDGPLEKVRVEPNFVRNIGLVMQMGKIEGVQPNSPAEKAVDASTGDSLPILANDQITKVDGENDFDPMRLPDLLAEKAGRTVELEILREGKLPQTLRVKVIPEAVPPWNDFPNQAILETKEEKFPSSIPAIGVAYHVGRTVRKILTDSPAAKSSQPIEPGDVVVKIEFQVADKASTEQISLDVENNWPQAFWNMQYSRADRTIALSLQRKDAAGNPVKIILEAEYDRNWPMHDRGFELAAEKGILKDASFLGAASLGWDRTKAAVSDIYLTLTRVRQGSVSTRSFSGPLSIFAVIFRLAKEEIGVLLWFVAFFNINLAIFNFLPIPILDGGHMVFLTYELIFRRKPKGWVVGFLNYAGLIFLLSLMVYVLSLDILRVTGYLRM